MVFFPVVVRNLYSYNFSSYNIPLVLTSPLALPHTFYHLHTIQNTQHNFFCFCFFIRFLFSLFVFLIISFLSSYSCSLFFFSVSDSILSSSVGQREFLNSLKSFLFLYCIARTHRKRYMRYRSFSFRRFDY